MTRLACMVLLGVCSSLVSVQGAIVTSTFDTNNDGWSTFGDGTDVLTNWSSTGGNPGGHVFETESQTGTVFYFSAPAKFLGNKSEFETLQFDLMREAGNLNDDDVILAGAGLTLAIDVSHPNTTWTHYLVHLNTGSNWRVNNISGAAATQAQIDAVMADLTALRIRGEYVNGTTSDTGHLDNVIMATPEPMSIVLTGAGLVALGTVRRRIRRA